MYPKEPIEFFKNKYKQFSIPTPTFHVVLGSGYGKAVDESNFGPNWIEKGKVPFEEVPGLFAATVPGHKGVYRFFEHKTTGKSVIFQVGRLHGYEGLSSKEVVRTVMSTLLAGTKNYILTNAAGSLLTDFKAGSVMVIEDQVNLTGQNPLTGENPLDQNGKLIGPRFTDMTETFDKKWQQKLKPALKSKNLDVHQGIYLGLAGPSFETPAEVKMYGRWGLHAVGMSTVWESLALKHAGARIAGLSLISNLGCGLSDEILDHEAILEVSAKSAKQIVEGIAIFIESELTGN